MNDDVVKEIKNINRAIEDNIMEGKTKGLSRGLLSQNILSQLRNFVEDVMVLTYNKRHHQNLTIEYSDKKIAYKEIDGMNNPRFLALFHKYLQMSKSHYTPDNIDAERLMQKYFYYLIQLKNYAKTEFNLELLNNIYDYPINMDESLIKYYKEILDQIKSITYSKFTNIQRGRYYVEDIKPIFVGREIIYELTLSNATDNFNKFDRIVAYTKYDILPNYAIKISTIDKDIELFSSKASIKIIINWCVSIRPCEINNLAKIFNYDIRVRSNMLEYKNMMNYLTKRKCTLLDLVLLSYSQYKNDMKEIDYDHTNYILQLLDRCREIILERKKGTNVIRYLLYSMRNTNIKKLICDENCDFMSNLYLKKSCYPFEKMPFVLALPLHIPKGEDLFMSLSSQNIDDQLLARYVLNNVEQKGILYTPIEEITNFENMDYLIEQFNSKLYNQQLKLKLIKESNYIYMQGYEDSTKEIIQKLNELSVQGIDGYAETYSFWEQTYGYSIDISDEKKNILKNLFTNSSVALIYGAAGTGKTTMINSISNTFANYSKIFLANTNAALENLKRRIKVANSIFYTIADFKRRNNTFKECDVLVIDECSTVSNDDMLNILNNSSFKLLMLVGDIYQIESIRFGNWFSYAKEFVNNNSIYELAETFRSNDEKLLTLWRKVRNKDSDIMEYIVHHSFSSDLNKNIFLKSDDEIILCLAYDGLYGINQINKYLQDNNPNKAYYFGIKTYKVGDPVIFFDTNNYGDILYNNLKGVITDINEDEKAMTFEIEIEHPLSSLDVFNSNITLVETKKILL